MAIRISVPSCACGMAGWGCFVEKFSLVPVIGKVGKAPHTVKYQWLVMKDLSIQHSEVRK